MERKLYKRHLKNDTEINEYGLRLLLPKSKEIKALSKIHKPSEHGHKNWDSSWLLIDYIEKSNVISKERVLEIGCGWGLSGIYCARKLGASVTAVDIDSEIQPFLALNGKINKVDVNFLDLGFDKIRSKILKNTDCVIGSDICFCDSLIDPLRRLIQRAKISGVGMVLLADPGRWPFDDLADLFVGKKGVELIKWEIKRPFKSSGKILKIPLRPH